MAKVQSRSILERIKKLFLVLRISLEVKGFNFHAYIVADEMSFVFRLRCYMSHGNLFQASELYGVQKAQSQN